MKRVVRWAIDNSPAMNMLMIGILLTGCVSLWLMRREVFPEFELEIVLVTVPYPGASPEEVEEGICQKIEEAVHSIEGIKKMTSVAKEGAGSVILELQADIADVQKVVTEVRSEVDRIPSFPELAEDPEVQQLTMRQPAIKVGVLAPEERELDELELRVVAEQVRKDLLALKAVSQVNLPGARNYQIDVEIDEDTLDQYGLTLQRVAQSLRRENIEIPGGTVRGTGQEVLLRGKNKGLIGDEIAKIPLVTDPNGVVLTVGDLGAVQDAFADTTAINEVNGRSALVLSIDRTTSEDLLAMTAAVRNYVKDTKLPGGYSMKTWGDRSTDVKDRLDLLIENGAMGLVLVFLVLAVFLELRLAFWVALGIPIAMLGAGSLLLLGGQTLNMLTMFAFLMALGIVVDDAIVVGENIYAHRQQGKNFVQAAVDGTAEVIPSVVASVTTTIIAFCPMLFVAGIMGKFIAVLPLAVIAMLVISLFESAFILPCHLAHRDNLFFRIIKYTLWPLSFIVRMFAALNRRSAATLGFLIHRTYAPTLSWSLRNRWTVVSAAAAVLLMSIGFVISGFVPFVIFPKLDSNTLQAKVTFPDGTPSSVTEAAIIRVEEALRRVDAQYAAGGMPILKLTHRSVGHMSGGGMDPMQGGMQSGSFIASVDAELVDTTQRDVTSETISAEWRQQVGEIAGIESLSIGAQQFGPAGTPIEFKLLGQSEQTAQLEAAVERCKEKLATYPGVFDVDDDSRGGKWELQIRVKQRAKALGITTADLAETIRAAYYGAEAMRLQRGRHEIKLMVRYPSKDRRSLADFDDIHIRVNPAAAAGTNTTGLGAGSATILEPGGGGGTSTAALVEIPVTELAEIDVVRGYSEINRVDQLRSITVSADLDESKGNADQIVKDLQKDFMPQLLAEHPGVRVRWEGQQEQTRESLGSLLLGTGVALLAMLFLLTLQFRSYLQPLLIIAIIPFGIIGAIGGHMLMNLPITLFSFFGIVALTGVVVNDSIVLIDFINHRVRDGMEINEALVDAGRRRFRPVLLTSLTTVAGLFPILIETSFQAQILIPMATSLSFGLLAATFLVVVLVPVLYRIYFDLVPEEEEEEEAAEQVAGAAEREIALAAEVLPETA